MIDDAEQRDEDEQKEGKKEQSYFFPKIKNTERVMIIICGFSKPSRITTTISFYLFGHSNFIWSRVIKFHNLFAYSSIMKRSNASNRDSQMISDVDKRLCREKFGYKRTDRVLLVCSSFFFFITASYGIFYAKQYIPGAFSFLAGVVSILYWIRPGNNWRLTLDLIVSKLLAVFYSATGLYCVQSISQIEVILALPLTFLMVGGYYMSNVNWEQKKDAWVYFHFMFHFFGNLAQINTLTAIQKCAR